MKNGNKLKPKWGVASHLFFVGTLVIASIAATVMSTGVWGELPDAVNPQQTLDLTVAAPGTATVGQPLEDIVVRLLNGGPPARDSRLRLIVHADTDREIRTGDITIDVQEDVTWKQVLVEPIDSGVMGAIGEKGSPHDELNERGGFEIPANANMDWRLRVTFRIPGRYTLVVSVSPDNGSTQLATPASINMEVS